MAPPFDEVAFTEDTLFFSDLVGAEQGLTQRTEAGFDTDPARDDQQVAAAAEPIEDECSSPPAQPWRHQRCSGHHHHVLDQVAGQHAANKTPARSQLGEHHCSYRCLWKVPGGRATDDQREELLSNKHRQSFIKELRQARWTSTPIFYSKSCL